MITAGIDPLVAKHVPDADDMSDDPYREALCLRAALCAAALEIRAIDPAAAAQLLAEERAVARSMIAP
jgi:hypothetical protein